MKIKLVLDINKTQQAQLNAVVTGRQGDKETVTVNVFIVDSGVPYNLTGQDIYYEGLKPNNAYVRDKTGVKMINAIQGNFEYTFRPETFGVAGVGRRSYFSIEQGGTVRASTQDFGIVTLADAMTGHTMSGPYISELEQLIQEAQWLVNDINSRWTSINTQLTQLQNKLNTMDVVKRSGDTMTGNLNFDTTTEKRITSVDNMNKLLHGMVFRGNLMQYYDFLKSKSIFSYDLTNELFYVTASTNLLKKTGDTATGHMIFRHNINQETADGLKGVNMVVNSSVNKWSVAPKMDGNPVWANEFAMNLTNGEITVTSLKTKKDGRADLTLTADATTFDAGYSPIADRRGNTVTLRMAIQRVAGSSSRIVTTLPTDMRPIATIVLAVSSTDGTMGKVTITTTGEIWIESLTATSILGKNLYISTSYVVN
ncbi:BppU family phage baseplate upper protein [Bacillus cereus group sp. BcHK140]|uniref:BppU family phage baseplate upper protein n=1 Tax=Bacillus cereus group sp. BcHK140 TaxID=3018092 RepID=UPI0022E37EE9|nr:BppU family phage baseplate upper protein [Bacillus cereus group sp. BcHK140]MDA1920656.1 BppU family phage baseplate upper protein [Bacillus cereus group sp. BcHK140]